MLKRVKKYSDIWPNKDFLFTRNFFFFIKNQVDDYLFAKSIFYRNS